MVEVSAKRTMLKEKELEQKDPKLSNKGRVIIVEDDDFLRGLLSHNMMDAGFNVKPACDAETAFKLLRVFKPDIVLLDLILPGMNGFDFLQEIKQKEKNDFPVLVLSNLGSQEDIDTAKALGAVDFLIKANVTPGQIVEKVNLLLG